MQDMLVSLLPVFMILVVGAIIRKLNILEPTVIDGLKTIIIKIALPGVLFMAFAKAEMGIGNLYIFLLVFLYCVILLLIGSFLHKIFPKTFPDEYTGEYFTGFEFGMIGIGLFTAIWGMDKLPVIAVIAFGHEIFIWFIYIPRLEAKKNRGVRILDILLKFIKSPIIIGILLGIVVNLLGFYNLIGTFVLGKAFLNGLTMLGNIIAPMILIVIGYSLSFKSIPVKKSLLLLITRWIAVLGLGFGLITLIKYLIPDINDFFIKAFYAFILLPPPFVLPLFMKEEQKEEIAFFSELLIYYTILSFIGYVVLMSII